MKLKFWQKTIKQTISTKDGEDLTPWEIEFVRKAECPDCESQLMAGPRGGGAINAYCADYDGCGSRFNILFAECVQRITDRQPARK